MSRVGNRPIKIKEGVSIEVLKGKVILKSAKGTLEVAVPEAVSVAETEGSVLVKRQSNDRFSRSQHGLVARLIRNGMGGLSEGIKKTLDFKGTGYRARIENGKIILNMGYSHEVELEIPEGIDTNVVKNSIIVSGYDSALVGNFAAKIREVRPPEVYKGKGIKYSDESIRRKAGKVAAAKG